MCKHSSSEAARIAIYECMEALIKRRSRCMGRRARPAGCPRAPSAPGAVLASGYLAAADAADVEELVGREVLLLLSILAQSTQYWY